MGPADMIEIERALHKSDRAIITAVVAFRYGTPLATIQRVAENQGRPLREDEVALHTDTVEFLRGRRRLLLVGQNTAIAGRR